MGFGIRFLGRPTTMFMNLKDERNYKEYMKTEDACWKLGVSGAFFENYDECKKIFNIMRDEDEPKFDFDWTYRIKYKYKNEDWSKLKDIFEELLKDHFEENKNVTGGWYDDNGDYMIHSYKTEVMLIIKNIFEMSDNFGIDTFEFS